MRIERHLNSAVITLASAVLATIFLIACQQSQQPASPATAQTAVASTEKVFVIFEGPWAFVADPKDANSVIALAPKTTSHRDLFAQTWDKTLASGIYELSIPGRSGPGIGTVDPNILQAKIDPQSVQHALDSKSERYAVRLPKPDAYVEHTHYRSRAGSSYPPDASSEKDYVSSISLRYSVTTLNGFSLSGNPDSGNFNPLLLKVDTPVINFAIEPAHDLDPKDQCHTHARQAFHDLTKLVNVSLFVDFPSDPSGCHDKDPQDVHPAKGKSVSALRDFLERGSPGGYRQRLLTIIYFFGAYNNCQGPGIYGGG